ncbi:hypothetical protein UFOVP238_13 [uncultured Caudovirales phage]|uniref:DUF3109 family protein n=1 Tax=uncultured Caudovirales phage TaxID=2100421 RepID=A0A6J7WVW0_9CAUD|nr:hypothetical protein UFOVP238_13 [uncultured Caudovirales phage]
METRMDGIGEWLSFRADGEEWVFETRWMTSNWKCVWGSGCLGIGEEPDELAMHGCCSLGAHFVDKDDRENVKANISALTPELWQYHGTKKPIHKNKQGDWVTRVVDGACVFLNRPDFGEQGSLAGCAFHHAAAEHNESYVDWKPEVCSAVPHRLEYIEGQDGSFTNLIREWRRGDWGEGGEEFYWWCTDNSKAYVADDMVYRTCKDELTNIMGEEAYKMMADILDRYTEPYAGGTWVSLPEPRTRN